MSDTHAGSYSNLTLVLDGGICRVTLNRPEVHNAFNGELIDELHRAFAWVSAQEPGIVRAVVLAGNGKSFCAGADVNWMRAGLDLSREENEADSMRMARMFQAINNCPVPVVGRIHGAALGGGVGLAAVCDIVVAAADTRWGLSEVKLGIAPAVISPYVLQKTGRSHARALFFTGERFGSDRALQIGLAHYVVPPDRLDEEVARITAELMTSSPRAIARSKELIAAVPDLAPDDATQRTVQTIAALRVSPEGQEGLRAFLERRKPGWAG